MRLDAMVPVGCRLEPPRRWLPAAARGSFALLIVAVVSLSSCRRDQQDPAPAASASARASASAGATPLSEPLPERARQLLAAEHRRDSKAVKDEDLSNRDVIVRRRAARALARIGDARAHQLLSRAVSDEDRQVVAWSAYGLGQTCRGREIETVRRLIARAASLSIVEHADPVGPLALDPVAAIADALARCDSPEAEATLRAWLAAPGEQADHAALSLGRLAARRGRLEDASIVALLDAATRPTRPLASALYAFTRLGRQSASIEERLLAAAKESLTRKGAERSFAVRALGRAGVAAAALLGQVLRDSKYSPSERADAGRELKKLGAAGQAELGAALNVLAPASKSANAETLVSASWGPLMTVLEALETPVAAARRRLVELSELPVAAGSSKALARRIVMLRCRAASLLAGTASLSNRLVRCDTNEKGRTGALATLEVLDRGPLRGARYARWLELVQSSDPVVRQAALRLMPGHPEILAPHRILSEALRSNNQGLVATAGEILAAYPDRAAPEVTERRAATRTEAGGAFSGELPALKPDPELVSGLMKAYEKLPADAIAARVALLEAAAALQLLSLKPTLEGACKSDNPTLRSHAERGLRMLGERGRKCNDFAPAEQAPPEVATHLPTAVRLEFETDLGPLAMVIDPELAPVSAARIVTLARKGFYDGLAVHRVVPGFVAQFGDPDGDGYGGAAQGLLRSEGSPVDFEAWSVGLALSGRDTGSSQLFVTLGPYPHLFGDYPLLGRAEPGFAKLANGDIIRKVSVP